MLHRLRHISDCPIFKEMLKNVVEIDETFIGGKNKNRHWDKKVPHSQGRNWKDKIPVLGILERGGNLIVKVVPNTQQKTLEPIIKANVKEGSTIYSDDWYRHSNLSQTFNHQWVNHSAKQYAKGDVSVNSIESFWNFPKRGIYGTYHWISRKHAQKYMDEFALRYNTRKYDAKERFNLVLLSSIGKSLSYRELTSTF
jgi:transposase-like protein